MNTLRFSVACTLFFAIALLVGCSEETPMTPNTAAELASDGVDQKGVGEAGPALMQGNNTVPIHMEVFNTIEIVGPPPPPALHAIFEGYGNSHPFGPFDLYSTSEIIVVVIPNEQTADYVFTFRNGDELHANSVGTAIEDPPGIAVFHGDITFSGGTGRFSNATGTGTYAGTADPAAGTGHFLIDGHISGFGRRMHQE
jgi:hypothetical protein